MDSEGQKSQQQASTSSARGLLLRVLVAVAAVLLLIVVIVLAVLLGLAVNGKLVPQASKPDVCMSSSCVQAAMGVIQYVDTSVDPCDDFYAFACGNWLKSVQHPFRDTSDSSFDDRVIEVNDDIQRLFEKPPKDPSLMGIYGYVQGVFNGCMDNTTHQLQGITQFTDYLNNLGILNRLLEGGIERQNTTLNQSEQEIAARRQFESDLVALTKLAFIPFLFDLKVMPNRLKPGTNYILLISSICIVRSDSPDYDSTFTMFIQQVNSILLNTTFSRPMEASMILQWCKELDTLYPTNIAAIIRSRTPPQLTTLKTASQQCDSINFMSFVQHLFASAGVTLDDTTEIHIVFSGLIENMCGLVKRYLATSQGRKALYDFLYLQTYVHMVPYLPVKYKISTDFFHPSALLLLEPPPEVTLFWATKIAVRSLTEQEFDQVLKCIKTTEDLIEDLVASLYVNTYHSKFSEAKIQKMVRNIQRTAKQMFRETPWMSPESRAEAVKKVDYMKDQLGFPQYLLNVTQLERKYNFLAASQAYLVKTIAVMNFQALSRLHTFTTNPLDQGIPPQMVNAVYMWLTNKMIIPVGIMGGVFYNSENPDYLNYGSLGYVVGHELGHGFDNNGRQYDYNGILRDWWDNGTVSKYEDLIKCYVDQYNSFTMHNTSMNGKKTLGENIADNLGIKMAFKAYKEYVGVAPRLPGVDFTPEQLYYIAFARTWCHNSPPIQTLVQVTFGVHSPGMIRVLGTISNSVEFSKTFGCAAGRKMNPKKKCYLF